MAAMPRRVAWGLTPLVLCRVVVSAANPTIRARPLPNRYNGAMAFRFGKRAARDGETLRHMHHHPTTAMAVGGWTRERAHHVGQRDAGASSGRRRLSSS